MIIQRILQRKHKRRCIETQGASGESGIIGLRFFEGMSHEQIGAVLNLKAATVRVALSRALAKLRQRLGDEHLAHFNRR